MAEQHEPHREQAVPDSVFQPLIIAFCCHWCAYPGADLAGALRIQYPPNVRVIRVQCSGMVHSNLVIEALTKGVDGVLLLGCHPGDCHYGHGNRYAEQRADAISLALEDLGLEPERFWLASVSASEGHRFAQVVRDMQAQIERLGPSPYRDGR